MTDINYIRRFEGCEDFELVVSTEDTNGYEWATFDVFYSPSQKRYFWYDGSGCSCDAPYDGVDSRSSFQDGDYQQALKAVKAVKAAKSSVDSPYTYSEASLNRAIEALRKKNHEVSKL